MIAGSHVTYGDESASHGVYLSIQRMVGIINYPLSMEQVVHAWSPSGNYLAYATRNSAGSICLICTTCYLRSWKQMFLSETSMSPTAV